MERGERLPRPDDDALVAVADALPPVLLDVRGAIRRQAERGVAAGQAAAWQAESTRLADLAAASGFSAFAKLRFDGVRPGEGLLRLNYLCMQIERTLGAPDDDAA